MAARTGRRATPQAGLVRRSGIPEDDVVAHLSYFSMTAVTILAVAAPEARA